MTAPEDDRPVGEVPPTGCIPANRCTPWPAPHTHTQPDPYQALLTQLHEVKTREAALRAGIEGLVPCADLLLAAEASWGGWAHKYAKLGHSLRALLDGEVRP